MNLILKIVMKSLDALKEKLAESARKAVREAATEAIALILNRVSHGGGRSDQQMPAYSRRYAALRARSGRQSEIRDLSYTGRMLTAISVVSTRTEGSQHIATIGFSDARARELALYHQIQTPWFGMSNSDIAALSRMYRGIMARELK